MANAKEPSADALLNGEFYLNEHTGRTHVRLPAGGAGGGVTSYADVPATEEQHVAFLKLQAELKQAETDALHERHELAKAKLDEKRAKEGPEEVADDPESKPEPAVLVDGKKPATNGVVKETA